MAKKTALSQFPALQQRARKLDVAYGEVFEKLSNHVVHQNSDVLRCEILLDAVLEEFLSAQEANRNVHAVVGKNFFDYMKKVEKRINFKKAHKQIQEKDYELFVTGGVWFTLCSYLFVLFAKEFITNHYLINFQIDLIVGVIAFYMALHRLLQHYRILQKHQMSKQPFYFEVAAVGVCIFLILLTPSSPFDLSFLLLVIMYLFNKRLIKKQFEAQM